MMKNVVNLSDNALEVAKTRYFSNGEDWESCTHRVAAAVSVNEKDKIDWTNKFHEMIYNMSFIPAGRILRNAGKPKGSMLNCYHLPCSDSIEEIGQFYKDALILWSEGGGVGCNFSSLRPKGDSIVGKGGKTSGLVSWIEGADAIASKIESGGQRRAAGLASVDVSHPEICEFIDAKTIDGRISYFNISVMINEDFLQAVEENKDWELKFKQRLYNKIPARYIWDKIIHNMLKHAEPGLLNSTNFTKNNSWYYDPVTGTNPSLRKGTKILTKCGIFPIEILENSNFDVPTINKTYSNANCFLSGKNKNLYKITLQGGHIYYATAEHRWPTVNKDKWSYDISDFTKKYTDELKSGDFLPQPEFKTSLGYGNVGNYEDGFLIGWNLGDGWISNNDRPNQIGFIVSKEDQEYNIHKILENKLKELNWNGSFSNDANKETNIQNKTVRDFFNKFGVTKKEYGIPTTIWCMASEDFRKGFIDGLFSSDGSVSDRIVLTSSKEKLIYDISELLGFYGIQTSIKHTINNNGNFPNGKKYEKDYHRYDLKITRQSSILHFYNTFKFSNGKKQEKLENLIKSYSLIEPSHTMEVISVEKTDLYEDVWDITVFDKIHCFELSQVITGNCGEAVLSPYDACNLGALVLPNFITGNVNTNWQKLEKVIKLAVRFLDNVLDVNKYTLKDIDIKAHNSRRIGLGVMGLADYLLAKEIRYGSKESLTEIERLTKFIRDSAYQASVELAVERGSFPKFDPLLYTKSSFIRKLPGSLRLEIKEKGIRNVTVLSYAPTGTTSLLPEVSSGIEPLTFKAYKRADRVSERIYIHQKYKKLLLEGKDLPDWFVDSTDLEPKDHFEVQAVVQRFTDGAVSKTLNFPAGTTPEQLSRYLLEYMRDLKGVTVYVDGSREGQIYNKLTKEEVLGYIKEDVGTDKLMVCDVECGTCSITKKPLDR